MVAVGGEWVILDLPESIETTSTIFQEPFGAVLCHLILIIIDLFRVTGQKSSAFDCMIIPEKVAAIVALDCFFGANQSDTVVKSCTNSSPSSWLHGLLSGCEASHQACQTFFMSFKLSHQ